MKTLIVSDIHLGSVRSHAKQLADFLNLNWKNYGRIILNGDVFDDLNFNRLPKEQWELVSFLRGKSNDLEIVWICGNHDTETLNVLSHLTGIPVMDKYIVTENGVSFLVTHGHTLNPFYKMNVAIETFFKWVYKGIEQIDKNGIIPSLLDKFFKDNTKTYALAMVKFTKYDWIICGHSHLPEANIPYANSGAWINGLKTYIEIDSNGNLTLQELK